jgi:hypothetical protein
MLIQCSERPLKNITRLRSNSEHKKGTRSFGSSFKCSYFIFMNHLHSV